MKDNKAGKNSFWNFVDALEGDKVVWMITLMLILISIVAIFSSTSQLALTQKTTRMAIVKEQHDKAKRILEEHRDKLDELAAYLYERETITGEEFMRILNAEEA